MTESTTTSAGRDGAGDTVSLAKDDPSDLTQAGTSGADSQATAEPGRKRGRRARRAAAAARGAAGEAGTSSTARTGEAGESAAASGAGAKAGRARSTRLGQVIIALLVIAVLLAIVLLVQLIKGPGDGGKLAAREDRREAARQAADTAVARLFSFDYKKLDADLAAHRAQTTGDFTNEVEKVTGRALRPIAAKEHVVVQAVSLGSAVIDDSGSDVQVLVFLNQAVTLDLLPAPRLDRNRV